MAERARPLPIWLRRLGQVPFFLLEPHFPQLQSEQVGGHRWILSPAPRASSYLEGSPVGHPDPTCGALPLCLHDR